MVPCSPRLPGESWSTSLREGTAEGQGAGVTPPSQNPPPTSLSTGTSTTAWWSRITPASDPQKGTQISFLSQKVNGKNIFFKFFLGDSSTLVTEFSHTSNKFVTDLSASDEDAGFGSHGEKTRYATLQRMQRYTPAPSSSNYNQQQCDPNTRAGYQTMRPYRHDNSGIPTIVSQTYAPTLFWAFPLSFDIEASFRGIFFSILSRNTAYRRQFRIDKKLIPFQNM